jgi:hypothetical protein
MRRRVSPAVLLAAALLGCDPDPDPATAPPVVMHPTIHRWMQCQECDRGERDSVVALGQGAVPTLRQLLLYGPPLALVALVESELKRQLPSGPPGTTQAPPAGAVDLMLDDYRSGYRIRSSMALGGIGGDSARMALCDGLAQQFPRKDVVRAIQAALLDFGGTCP